MYPDELIDTGEAVHQPSLLESLRMDSNDSGWTWALVEVDTSQLDDKAERINITLPRRVLGRIDV